MSAPTWQSLTAPGAPFEVGPEFIEFRDKSAPHHQTPQEYLVFKRGLKTVPDLIALGARPEQRNEEFLVHRDVRLTFAQAQEAAECIARSLQRLGVGCEDRVAIASRNCPEYCLAIMGSQLLGAKSLPMNSWWTTSELEYGLQDACPVVLFVDEERLERITPILPKLDFVRAIVTIGFDAPAATIVNAPSAFAVLTFAQMQASGGRRQRGEAEVRFQGNPESNAFLLYTSGTTAHPKGVVLTHRGVTTVMNSLWITSQLGDAARRRRGVQALPPVTLLAVPLFHITGLHGSFLSSFYLGRKIVFMPGRKWNPEEALALVEREKVTQFMGVPTQTIDMLNSPALSKHDVSSLATLGAGGSATPPSLLKDTAASPLRKASVSTAYGLSEVNGGACGIGGESFRKRPTSVGRPYAVLKVAIWDDNGQECPPNVPGRIVMRGAQVMKEYWRNPKATAEAVTADGWFDSGDIGALDNDGFLYILDRAKDIVIRGGENITCAEVERALYTHPGIQECAVFGVPHPSLGEEVAAAVFMKPGHEQPTLRDIQAACGTLARFKVPVHLFHWKEQLPRGATGKILKRAIRREVLSLSAEGGGGGVRARL